VERVVDNIPGTRLSITSIGLATWDRSKGLETRGWICASIALTRMRARVASRKNTDNVRRSHVGRLEIDQE